MNFERFVKDGLISMTTRDWIEPLWHREEEEVKGVREAVETNHNLFGNDNEEEEEGFTNDHIVERTSLTILETKINYQQDDNSSGHGNRVWAAAIATCYFLRHYNLKNVRSLRSVELGAGTAVPSLYLAHLLVDQESHILLDSSCVHITDAKQYRNIRQILASVAQQPESLRQRVQFRVSPHDWGIGVGMDGDRSFLNDECCFGAVDSNRFAYDLVVVSDCIYNFRYHSKLLHSIAGTLALPMDLQEGDPTSAGHQEGGCAIVSFSLHGNTSDSAVWKFFEMANSMYSFDGKWRLQSDPVSSVASLNAYRVGETNGYDMEAIMKGIGAWIGHLEPRRWTVYLYTLRWVPYP